MLKSIEATPSQSGDGYRLGVRGCAISWDFGVLAPVGKADSSSWDARAHQYSCPQTPGRLREGPAALARFPRPPPPPHRSPADARHRWPPAPRQPNYRLPSDPRFSSSSDRNAIVVLGSDLDPSQIVKSLEPVQDFPILNTRTPALLPSPYMLHYLFLRCRAALMIMLVGE